MKKTNSPSPAVATEIKTLKDLPTEAFAMLSFEDIRDFDIYSDLSKNCTVRDPRRCSFSLFFADTSGSRWVGCCPEAMAIPAERLGIKNSAENLENSESKIKAAMGATVKSAEKLKLYEKWRNQLCPYQKDWGL
jgi:hypothetical protein